MTTLIEPVIGREYWLRRPTPEEVLTLPLPPPCYRCGHQTTIETLAGYLSTLPARMRVLITPLVAPATICCYAPEEPDARSFGVRVLEMEWPRGRDLWLTGAHRAFLEEVVRP